MYAWRYVCVCMCMSVLCLRGGCIFCVMLPALAFSYLFTSNTYILHWVPNLPIPGHKKKIIELNQPKHLNHTVCLLLRISQLLIRNILSDDRYDDNRGVVTNILIALLDRKFNLPIKRFLAMKALTALFSNKTSSTTMWTLVSALIVFPTVEISYNLVFFRNKMTKLQRRYFWSCDRPDSPIEITRHYGGTDNFNAIPQY